MAASQSIEDLKRELAQERAEKAAAQAVAATAQAEVAAAQARALAAETENGVLRAAAGSGDGAGALIPPLRCFAALSAALACLPQRVVDSPTKAGVPSIQGALACFDAGARPLAPDLEELSAAPSL